MIIVMTKTMIITVNKRLKSVEYRGILNLTQNLIE